MSFHLLLLFDVNGLDHLSNCILGVDDIKETIPRELDGDPLSWHALDGRWVPWIAVQKILHTSKTFLCILTQGNYLLFILEVSKVLFYKREPQFFLILCDILAFELIEKTLLYDAEALSLFALVSEEILMFEYLAFHHQKELDFLHEGHEFEDL